MKHKRFLSLLTTITILISLLPCYTLTTYAADADTSWYSDSYTSFTLYDAADLAGLASLVNAGNDFSGKTIKLGNSINLSSEAWTPIGTSTAPFKGTFDGQGYQIQNLNVSGYTLVGLFGYADGSAVIKNVTVTGVASGTSYVGGIVGYTTSEVTVANCTNSAAVSSSGTRVGGVVGYNVGTVSDCTNTGTVASDGARAYTGGIAGYNAGTVSNSYNTGNVSNSSTAAYYTGGIAGSNSGTVSNCHNTGAVSGGASIGGVVGLNDSGIVSNCYNTGTISSGNYIGVTNTGGVAGANSGTVSNSYNSGTVNGGTRTGGVVGRNNLGAVSNCYNIGTVSGGTYNGGVAGGNDATLDNNYYLNTTVSAAIGEGSGTATNVSDKTERQFASGEVAWLLNGSTADGTQAWYQNIDSGTADSYPVLDSTHGTVYYSSSECASSLLYSNSNSFTVSHAEFDEYGFCTICGGYQPATLNGDGVYEIANAGQLFWFASLVNGDTTQEGITAAVADADAILTADIDLSVTTSTHTSTEWTPIGDYSGSSISYSGTFDGDGHTVKGLYINSSSNYQGLFGQVSGGTVQNVTVSGNVIGSNYVGGVVGNANKGNVITNCSSSVSVSGSSNVGGVIGSNWGTVTSCINSGEVSGSSYVGGVVGSNWDTAANCINNGEVSGSSYVGGVVGRNISTLKDSYNIGTVNSTGDTAGGVVGYNYVSGYTFGTVSNCYYLDSTASAAYGTNIGTIGDDVLSKTTTEFASGEVTYLLNGGVTDGTQAWYQTIGTDAYPLLTSEASKKVILISFCKSTNGNVILESYTNPGGTLLSHPTGDEYTFYSDSALTEVISDISTKTFDTDTSVYVVTSHDLTIIESNGGAITEDTDYTYENKLLTVLTGGEYTISGTSTTDTIAVASSDDVTITLAGVSITNDDAPPMELTGTGTVTVKLSGTNTLKTENYDYAGLQLSSTDLIITSAAGDGETSGSLTATGGDGGAGIGSGDGNMNGNITINGGTVSGISPANGAGIGSGGYLGGNITINGGAVSGSSNGRGAGIGSGTRATVDGNIIINGGTVSGTSSQGGAGIGSGYSEYDDMTSTGYDGLLGNIEINGGTVTGTSMHENGAGIGTGCNSRLEGKIIITGGTVSGISYESGAGLGVGKSGSVRGSVNISGGYITAASEFGDAITQTNAAISGGYFADSGYSASTVYGVTLSSSYEAYENTDADTSGTYPCYVAAHTHTAASYDEYGFCTICGGYQPATQNSDGVYEISNAGQLFWFASLVNGDTTQEGITAANTSANAVLTADIDLSVTTSTHTSTEWTPIGTKSAPYKGTFDGNGKTISGLSITTAADTTEAVYVGLFGYINAGTVKDLTVSGEIDVSGSTIYAGGIVGTVHNSVLSNLTSNVSLTAEATVKGTFGGVAASVEGTGDGSAHSTMERCVNYGTVTASGVLDCVGGLTGFMNSATITNCENRGKVDTSGGTAANAGGIYTGGIVSYINNANAVVTNCVNVGEISSVDSSSIVSYTGAIVGRINQNVGEVSNCYYLSSDSSTLVGVGENGSGVSTETTAKDADALASGEVTWLLTGGTTDGTQAWYQNIDNGEIADSYPVLDSSHGTVYGGADCVATAIYSNSAVPAVSHSYVAVVTAPTCTEKGYTTYTCSVCGDSYTADETEATGHTTELQNAKDATCTTDGYTGDEVCTVCGETVTTGEVIPATGHTTEIQNAKDATCTEDGYTGDEVCTVCGETVTAGEVIPATGHTTEIQNAKDATCTEDGYTGDEVCTICGETVATGEVILATGHTTEIQNAKDATCTEDGYTGDEVCTICGETVSTGEIIPAIGHSYDSSVITKEATCTEDGIMTYICTNCGDRITEAIPATGHTTEIQNAKDATCTEDGYTGDEVCTVCGETVTAGEVIPATGHTTEIQNAKDATCTEDGYMGDEVCTVCGETVTTGEVIPATGHTTEIQNAKDATCTEDGYTGDEVCTVCGETVTTGEVIPATGHTTEIQNAKDATCTEDGYTGDEVCTVCGETVTTGEVIPATGHTTEIQNAKDATCTEDGYTGDEICTVCGETVTAGKVIPATGHSYDESVITKEATCTEDGVMTYICTNCGDRITEAIPATGHTTEIQNAKDATCTEDGYTGDEVCTICGETVRTGEVIPATGHSTEIQNAKDATCTEDGYTGDEVCTVCGETVTTGEVIPATGHITEIQNAKDATCTEDGYTGDEICTICGETVTTGEVIPATGHTTEIQNAKDATCTEDGYTGDEVCTVCGETVTAGEVIPATGHSYNDGVVTTEPTCTVEGVMTYTCTECGHTYTESIAAKGHTEVIDEAVEPTCTESGLTEGSHCSECDIVIKAQEIVPATGHIYDEGEIIEQTGCAGEGLIQYTCTVCGDTYTEVISAEGHVEVIDEAVEPTCTEPGLTEGSHCSECGAVIVKQEIIPATGHSYDEGVITIDATCTENGEMTYTCTECGDTYTEVIAALGHDYSVLSHNDTEHWYECSVCGEEQPGSREAHSGGISGSGEKAVCDVCGAEYGKADPTYELPTGLTANYGDTLADVTLPDGWTWANESLSVGDVGTNTFTAVFTPDDTENYNTITAEITVTVSAVTLTVTEAPTAARVKRGNTLSKSTLSGGSVTVNGTEISGTWAWADETETMSKSGTYERTAVFSADDEAYGTVEAEVTVTVYTSGGGGGGSSSGTTVYTVTAEEIENGDISFDNSTAKEGATVTITVTPDEGFETESITVTDASGNEIELTQTGDDTYTFVMPSSEVSISAEFTEIETETEPTDVPTDDDSHDCLSEKFTDVDTTLWYHEYIDYVLENGLMNGTGGTTFEPNTATTRAMIVTILYRLEGEPKTSSAAAFTDIASGNWYADAVAWAAENGIVLGYGDGTFGANDVITREQTAAILYRYASYKGADTSIGEDTNILSYTDADEISEYAIPAMQWAVGTGLMNGKGNNTLDPQGGATRAETAAMLMRFIEK